MENIKDAVKNADREKFMNQHYSCIWNTSLNESKDKNIRGKCSGIVTRENIRLKRTFASSRRCEIAF